MVQFGLGFVLPQGSHPASGDVQARCPGWSDPRQGSCGCGGLPWLAVLQGIWPCPLWWPLPIWWSSDPSKHVLLLMTSPASLSGRPPGAPSSGLKSSLSLTKITCIPRLLQICLMSWLTPAVYGSITRGGLPSLLHGYPWGPPCDGEVAGLKSKWRPLGSCFALGHETGGVLPSADDGDPPHLIRPLLKWGGGDGSPGTSPCGWPFCRSTGCCFLSFGEVCPGIEPFQPSPLPQ